MLHRNKACLSCRARKTKCDAIKPICSTCKRLGPQQQTECKYDQPPKWLESVVSPNRTQQEHKRITELEEKLESLQQKLAQLKTTVAIQQAHISHDHNELVLFHNSEEMDHFQSAYNNQPFSYHHQPITLIEKTQLLTSDQHHLSQQHHLINDVTHPEFITINPYHFITPPILESPSPSTTSSIPDPSPPSPLHHLSFDPSLPLSEPSWFSHLPSRKICKLLIKAFFNRPLAPFTLVEPVGLQSRLDLNILHAHFPEPALIHAICATGAQYISPECLTPIYWASPLGPHVHHAQWAERLLNHGISTLREPRKLLELAEAAILCCQYYTVIGKPLMIWKNLGCCIRLATLMGLNNVNLNNHHSSSPLQDIRKNHTGLEKVTFWPDGVEVLDRPANANIQHYRTVLWWYMFCCEKICAAAGGFASTVDERDSMIPISCPTIYRVNKENGSYGRVTREEEEEEREFLSPASPSFFFKHRTGDLGSLQLLIKMAILLGRVNTTVYRRSHPAKTPHQMQQEHENLSNLIWGLYHSIPASLKNPFKSTRHGYLDACLLSAHTFIHTSLIQLNEDLVSLDHRAPSEDPHLQICKLSGQLMIDWFLQLIQQKNLGLIDVDLGQLLCGNPTLNFGLSVAMRTHCRLIAINRVYAPSAGFELDALTLQVKHILAQLSKSARIPLAGRIIELINSLLQAPYSLLPRSLLSPPIDPTSSHQSQHSASKPADDSYESMQSNFALARLLNCSSSL